MWSLPSWYYSIWKDLKKSDLGHLPNHLYKSNSNHHTIYFLPRLTVILLKNDTKPYYFVSQRCTLNYNYLLIKGRLLVGQSWWSRNIFCHVFDIELAISQTFFHMSNKVKNISGNLHVQHWRSVVSSNLWAQVWEQGLCYLFASRQLYSESHFKYKGGSEFLISHWKNAFCLLPWPT